MSEERAKSFLSSNSYFFKIKSYENNYPRHGDGDGYRYEGLDFDYLVELSLIDFALSRLVWSMCSSIEHGVKVRLNQLLMQDDDPDIAEKCVRRCWSGNLPQLHDNPYTDDLKVSCHNDFAPWQLWELLGFNEQLRLYEAYYRLKDNQEAPNKHLLFIVRKMRNAVSHGNCLLADVKRLAPTMKDTGRSDAEVTSAAMRMCDRKPKTRGRRANTFQHSLDRLVVNNYAAVLLCHLEFVCSPRSLDHSCDEVQKFLDRVDRRRAEYFGDKGVRQPRNQTVDSTLEALVTLSKGYIRKAHKKASDLDANDPYGSRKRTPAELRAKVTRRKEHIRRIQDECDALESEALELERLAEQAES